MSAPVGYPGAEAVAQHRMMLQQKMQIGGSGHQAQLQPAVPTAATNVGVVQQQQVYVQNAQQQQVFDQSAISQQQNQMYAQNNQPQPQHFTGPQQYPNAAQAVVAVPNQSHILNAGQNSAGTSFPTTSLGFSQPMAPQQPGAVQTSSAVPSIPTNLAALLSNAPQNQAVPQQPMLAPPAIAQNATDQFAAAANKVPALVPNAPYREISAAGNAPVRQQATQVVGPVPANRRITLVLDLDETLSHTNQSEVKVDAFPIKITFEHKAWVQRRPFVEQFIRTMSGMFDLVLWTAAPARIAKKILAVIDSSNLIKRRLFREDCTISANGQIKVKDLRKLNKSLEGVLILDDNPTSSKLQPSCGLPIRKFFSDVTDCELPIVARQLELLMRVSTCHTSFSAGLAVLREWRNSTISQPSAGTNGGTPDDSWLVKAIVAIAAVQKSCGTSGGPSLFDYAVALHSKAEQMQSQPASSQSHAAPNPPNGLDPLAMLKPLTSEQLTAVGADPKKLSAMPFAAQPTVAAIANTAGGMPIVANANMPSSLGIAGNPGKSSAEYIILQATELAHAQIQTQASIEETQRKIEELNLKKKKGQEMQAAAGNSTNNNANPPSSQEDAQARMQTHVAMQQKQRLQARQQQGTSNQSQRPQTSAGQAQANSSEVGRQPSYHHTHSAVQPTSAAGAKQDWAQPLAHAMVQPRSDALDPPQRVNGRPSVRRTNSLGTNKSASGPVFSDIQEASDNSAANSQSPSGLLYTPRGRQAGSSEVSREQQTRASRPTVLARSTSWHESQQHQQRPSIPQQQASAHSSSGSDDSTDTRVLSRAAMHDQAERQRRLLKQAGPHSQNVLPQSHTSSVQGASKPSPPPSSSSEFSGPPKGNHHNRYHASRSLPNDRASTSDMDAALPLKQPKVSQPPARHVPKHQHPDMLRQHSNQHGQQHQNHLRQPAVPVQQQHNYSQANHPSHGKPHSSHGHNHDARAHHGGHQHDHVPAARTAGTKFQV